MLSDLSSFLKKKEMRIVRPLKIPHWYVRVVFLSILAGVILYGIFLSPPSSFKNNTSFVIEEGLSLSGVSSRLYSQGFIRSPFLFEVFVISLEGEGGVRYGEYIFKKPESVWTIARRVVAADFQLTSVRVTVPEGSTVKDMAVIFEKRLSRFNKDLFVRIAKKDEGYLFPDSYDFFPNDRELAVYKKMRSTFDEKITPLQDDIVESGKSVEDIIIMASLLEKEARTTETRRMIAGILWKRLEIGMPLQVDAVFEYILGKNTYALTTEDLQIDSPYNTYKYKGLPAGPIANPGLDSIRAALNPIESPYLFYLSDREGNVYYSRTHDEHVIKKARYL